MCIKLDVIIDKTPAKIKQYMLCSLILTGLNWKWKAAQKFAVKQLQLQLETAAQYLAEKYEKYE